jgi:glycosyltransferase involved in cell wall biosynthesis
VSDRDGPLVNVVTPVYNGGRYLRQCIESVIAQTHKNWRYTIVNNASTDDTEEIAEYHARLDPRIHVHNNADFLPIIENHNLAFSLIAADSAYCKPLMADDWLYPECLETMLSTALAGPSIGLV